jgi:hypothetical protein
MLLMAVSGAVVLALVCWTLLNEPPPPSFTPFIPHPDSGERAGRAASAPDGQAPHPGGGTAEPDSGQDVAAAAQGHVPWEPAEEADGGELNDDGADLPRGLH